MVIKINFIDIVRPSIQGSMLGTRVKQEPIEEKEVSEPIEFDVNAFLASIPRPPPKPVTRPQCPRCMVDMTFGVSLRDDGSRFEYYRCPMTRFETKCYVTCGKDTLDEYVKAVDQQTHACYPKIPPENFRCERAYSMILAMSKSEKNPGRLYLKCPKNSCKLFQWINEKPRGLAKRLLLFPEQPKTTQTWVAECM